MVTAAGALHGLMTAIDEHRWDRLETYLHPDFVCTLVHTGERFTREEWIHFNADYPDFDRLVIEDLIADDDRAVCRSRVTARTPAGEQAFACASFARVRDDRIIELIEVWADIGQDAPDGTRPTG